jgi:seryl-tRNA synthetase
VTASLIAAEKRFYHGLVHHGLIIPLGVDGVFGRGAVFEEVVRGFSQLITTEAADQNAEALHFPPVIPRRLLEQSGFLASFPHLAGTVFSFEGTDAEHRELQHAVDDGADWSTHQTMTDVALASAACYPVYATSRGVLPAAGKVVDVSSYCFRREPSQDPVRLQSFRMRELVCLGAPGDVLNWRAAWIERSAALLESVGLAVKVVTAADPFFGRAGRLLAANQKELELKLEFVVPISAEERPTAVMSLNYHQEHFSSKFDIYTEPGVRAHTACLGFGLERIAMALFKRHGFDPSAWPFQIRSKLCPSRC